MSPGLDCGSSGNGKGVAVEEEELCLAGAVCRRVMSRGGIALTTGNFMVSGAIQRSFRRSKMRVCRYTKLNGVGSG